MFSTYGRRIYAYPIKRDALRISSCFKMKLVNRIDKVTETRLTPVLTVMPRRENGRKWRTRLF
jgi:hypothetical protein